MSKIHIISGCNGAGKTTASKKMLPEILQCQEFVNADTIAAEISPGNPAKAALEAGRLMLTSMQALMNARKDFAFETTLSTRSYVPFIKTAQSFGYSVDLYYFWLIAPPFAQRRVEKRVKEGGHHIPDDVIERRFYRGIQNLINLYIPIVDKWFVLENMGSVPEPVASGNSLSEKRIVNSPLWKIINNQSIPYATED